MLLTCSVSHDLSSLASGSSMVVYEMMGSHDIIVNVVGHVMDNMVSSRLALLNDHP